MDKIDNEKLEESFHVIVEKVSKIFTDELVKHKLPEAFAIGMECLKFILANHVEVCSPNTVLENKLKLIQVFSKSTEKLLIDHDAKSKLN